MAAMRAWMSGWCFTACVPVENPGEAMMHRAFDHGDEKLSAPFHQICAARADFVTHAIPRPTRAPSSRSLEAAACGRGVIRLRSGSAQMDQSAGHENCLLGGGK
jgi:hypothetical protein